MNGGLGVAERLLKGRGGWFRRSAPGQEETPRQTTLERFLFALGMTHVGETTAKALAHSFGDLAIIRQLPWPLFKCVPDIGGEVARAIGHFMDQPANQQAIDDLVERGVRITDAHPPHLHCAINSPWLASGTLGDSKNHPTACCPVSHPRSHIALIG